MSSSPISSVPALRDSLPSSCSAKEEEICYLAKYDGLLLLGYCVELFKDLESVCWVETRYGYG